MQSAVLDVPTDRHLLTGRERTFGIGVRQPPDGDLGAVGQPYQMLSVVIGFKARIGATLLIVFLIPTTVIFHDFWAYEAQQQQDQLINFTKNLAILGGLFQIAAVGPGPWSIDKR